MHNNGGSTTTTRKKDYGEWLYDVHEKKVTLLQSLRPPHCRMSHAHGKAEAAEGVAQKAMEECRLARITAKELSPSFHIYGNGKPPNWTWTAHTPPNPSKLHQPTYSQCHFLRSSFWWLQSPFGVGSAKRGAGIVRHRLTHDYEGLYNMTWCRSLWNNVLWLREKPIGGSQSQI